MMAAYRRSDRAATDYEIARVTVALRDLEGDGRCPGPDGSRAGGCGPMWSGGAAWMGGGARIPAPFGEQSSATGHGAIPAGHLLTMMPRTLSEYVPGLQRRRAPQLTCGLRLAKLHGHAVSAYLTPATSCHSCLWKPGSIAVAAVSARMACA